MTADPDGPVGADRRVLGAFAPLRALQAHDAGARRRLFGRLREAALPMLLTEGDIPPRVASEIRDAGLRLGGGWPCFSDHAGSTGPIPERLRPIISSGHPRPRMEWYRGIIPTDHRYEDDLVEACRVAATDPSLGMFVLDFIRWPVHWELEFRAGAQPLDSSFDPITLARFREACNVDVPVDRPSAAAHAVATTFAAEWATFKCDVIGAIVRRITTEIRAARPGLPIGAYIVPGSDEQRRLYAGQDVAALGRDLDVVLPMTYHGILGRPPGWVGEIVADMRSRTAKPVVPVLQASADPDLTAGSDWGPEFPPQSLGWSLDAALEAGAAGFVIFPAEGLDAARSAEVARRAVRLIRS